MKTPILETITPAKAEKMLDRNTGNRKLRDGVVEKYAADMRDGHWTECIVPIAFYDNGDIADGQHRLWAILESGTTQRFFVLRDLRREAGLNIDTGLGRSLVDNARISGIDPDLTNEMVSVARALETGERQRTSMPNHQRLELVNKHREAIKWTITHGPRGQGLRNQCFMAAVARAWYHEEDKERLARFCKVLSDGFAASEDESAAVALRNYMLTKRNAHLNQVFRETFLKAQNCIRSFMRRRSITLVKIVKEEAYPLPVDKKAEVKQRVKAIIAAKKQAQRQEKKSA